MGVIKQGILGGFSGKVGGVVGSSWKGIATMKSKPLSVANPRTAAQVAQRDKMTAAVAFAKPILADIIKPLWDRFAQKMSGFNDFISENILLFTGGFQTPAGEMVISQGKMAKTAIATLIGDVAGQDITVTWLDDSNEGFKLSSDEAFVVCMCYDSGEIKSSGGNVIRSAGTVTIPLDVPFEMDQIVAAWLAFRRVDGTIVSGTGFLSADAA